MYVITRYLKIIKDDTSHYLATMEPSCTPVSTLCKYFISLLDIACHLYQGFLIPNQIVNSVFCDQKGKILLSKATERLLKISRKSSPTAYSNHRVGDATKLPWTEAKEAATTIGYTS